ncbi:putative DNA-binding protein [Streptomyces griseus subsp. griseus NBRC 13350]|uniref:DNA-binding protein n=1 Tax=Streptomyces griseus subsp. griseus (strain JCM 4626 / CBS 651.72 / NBRC 13350 / KCC S-0626 / ISP 5235) TaxID=455632 RepID=B1W2R8_STRGG|nr:XRE family transcriptional regulator [Streptomyces griseus]BAG19432.1 putative DNA-binding protein [Streptomyces griseus subsp. griseus NBRC 13350]SEE90389.1 Helix-turn-helix domain-containing protein [Streptomyces griseus]SQA21107.1 DNA-binding protein [Streptomyces griseus]
MASPARTLVGSMPPVTRLRRQQIRPERNARPVPGRPRAPTLGTVSIRATNQADVIPLRPLPAAVPALPREPLWRALVGEVLRRERQAQGRTLKDVAEAARISMPYLSEVERGLKEASSEVLAAAAQALGLSLADVLALAGERLVSLTAARSRSRSLGPGAAGGRRSVRPAGPAGPTGSAGATRPSGPMGGVLLAA